MGTALNDKDIGEQYSVVYNDNGFDEKGTAQRVTAAKMWSEVEKVEPEGSRD